METTVPIEELLAHQAWVRGLARSLVRDDAAADDVTQETWISAIRRPPRPGGGVHGWLAAVVRNHARKLGRGERRRDARHAALAPPADAEPADETLARAEMQRKVADAVLRLDEPYRKVLLLRYFEDLTPTEIAARLGEPIDTVKTRLKRGLAKLRERLDDEHGSRRAWCLLLAPLARPEDAPADAGPARRISARPLLLGLAAVSAVAVVVTVFVVAGGGNAARGSTAPETSDAAAATPPSARTTARLRGPAAADATADENAAEPVALPSSTSANAAVRVSVRDFADGAPLAGFRVRVRLADGARRELATDAAGVLRLDTPADPAVEPLDPAWCAVPRPQLAKPDVQELWFHRVAGITALVVDAAADGDTPINLSDASVDFAFGLRRPAASANFPADASDDEERSSPVSLHPDVMGRIALVVPRVRELRIDVSAPHRVSAHAVVALTAEGELPPSVRLVLRAAPRLEGRLAAPGGEPLAGRRIVLRMDVPWAFDANGHRMPISTDGTASVTDHVSQRLEAETGADGSFDFEVPNAGTVFLAADPGEPYAPVHLRVGEMRDAMPEVQLRADAADAGTVRIAGSDAALANAVVSVRDVTPGEPCDKWLDPAAELTTDAAGALARRTFVAGRAYEISCAARRLRAIVVWNGDAEIRLVPDTAPAQEKSPDTEGQEDER